MLSLDGMRTDSFQDHRNQRADVTYWRPFTEPRTTTANKSDQNFASTMDY